MTRPGAAPKTRPRVLIAGAGVAGLEALLALRALAGDQVDVTIVAHELSFINRSMAVDQPFKSQRVRGVRLQDTAAELDARWHRVGDAADVMPQGEHAIPVETTLDPIRHPAARRALRPPLNVHARSQP